MKKIEARKAEKERLRMIEEQQNKAKQDSLTILNQDADKKADEWR